MGRIANVLVTDADERCAVAACESLSWAGYGVGTTSASRLAPANWSRFSKARYRTPDPRHSSHDFAARVAEIAHAGDYATVLPGCDAALIALSFPVVLKPRSNTVHPYFRGGDPRPLVVRYLQALRASASRRAPHASSEKRERA